MTNREQRASEVLANECHGPSAKRIIANGGVGTITSVTAIRAMLAFSDAERSAQSDERAPLTPAQLSAIISALNFVLAGDWDESSHEHRPEVYERALDKLQALKGRVVRAAPTPAQQSAPASDVLREALENVVNPLGYLQREAEAQGRKLSGDAYAIANDVHFVRKIAQDALAALTSAPQGDGTAIIDIASERRRQIEVEGWTPEHDDEHANGELSAAALCYCWAAQAQLGKPAFDPKIIVSPPFWPWDLAWWKPKGARRDLVRAAALIVAEIERLDRAALSQPSAPSQEMEA